KGVAIFVEAAKLVNEKGVEAVFKIAGGAVDHNPNCLSTEDMKSLIQDSPVEWLGKVDDMPSLYAEANLIVYPSYYGEGIPKVLLEAAATGRCIITTDHPGCREAILDGKTGMLVPVKDVEKTAAAMQELLKESVKRNSMGQAARTYAAECFDVNLVVAQTIAVYDKALAS
ncbi:MAG: glycosyltransferase, partial [Planctomycetota bacterium]